MRASPSGIAKNAIPFHAHLRTYIERAGLSQAEAAQVLRISPSTLEGWLASPEKSWHREPHYLMRVGALSRASVIAANRTRTRNAAIESFRNT